MNTFNPQNEKEPELFGEITDSRSGSGTVQAVPKTCYARKYVSAQRIREKSKRHQNQLNGELRLAKLESI